MSWLPGIGAWWAASLFALAAPLIVFYFLKLRRPRVMVPSLVLWRQVMEDRRVNSPFQKFKRNLLLLLQLLLLILLVLAAMQPFFIGGDRNAVKLPILIDTSASMGATDAGAGKTRLAEAKRRVRERIDKMLPGEQISLIAFSDSAKSVTGFTDNKRVLREALRQIEVADVPSSIEEGLRMAQALGRNHAFDRVWMLTDGNVPEQVDFGLSFELDYELLNSLGNNIGITAMNAQRHDAQTWRVFLSVEASGPDPASAVIRLTSNGSVLAEERVTAEPGGGERLAFDVEAETAREVSAVLLPTGADTLEADNRAWLTLPALRPLRVYVADTLAAARRSLAGVKAVSLYPSAEETDRVEYDVIITDQTNDLETLEARTWLLVGVIPEQLRDLVSWEEGGMLLVDWREDAALLEHVELGDLLTLRRPKAARGAVRRDYEEAGYTTLVETQTGPLLLESVGAETHRYVWTVHFDQTTLPYRVGFPIMLQNLVRIGRSEAGMGQVEAATTGVLSAIPVAADEPYQVDGPGDVSWRIRSTGDGRLTGVPAPRVGRYAIEGAGGEVANIGAGLLSREETLLEAVKELRFDEVSVAAMQASVKADQPMWRWLAGLGVIVLLAEWWYFQRMPGGRRAKN